MNNIKEPRVSQIQAKIDRLTAHIKPKFKPTVKTSIDDFDGWDEIRADKIQDTINEERYYLN